MFAFIFVFPGIGTRFVSTFLIIKRRIESVKQYFKYKPDFEGVCITVNMNRLFKLINKNEYIPENASKMAEIELEAVGFAWECIHFYPNDIASHTEYTRRIEPSLSQECCFPIAVEDWHKHYQRREEYEADKLAYYNDLKTMTSEEEKNEIIYIRGILKDISKQMDDTFVSIKRRAMKLGYEPDTFLMTNLFDVRNIFTHYECFKEFLKPGDDLSIYLTEIYKKNRPVK
jgi:hypothetical protein